MRLIILAIVLPTLYALAACGQKGPLTLPPDEETRALNVASHLYAALQGAEQRQSLTVIAQ